MSAFRKRFSSSAPESVLRNTSTSGLGRFVVIEREGKSFIVIGHKIMHYFERSPEG